MRKLTLRNAITLLAILCMLGCCLPKALPALLAQDEPKAVPAEIAGVSVPPDRGQRFVFIPGDYPELKEVGPQGVINVVKNGSFEYWSGSPAVPVDWHVTAGSCYPYSGGHSGNALRSGGHTYPEDEVTTLYQEMAGGELEMYVRFTTQGTGELEVWWYDGSWNLVNRYRSVDNPKDTWLLIKKDMPSSGSGELWLQLETWNRGWLDIDDVKMWVSDSVEFVLNGWDDATLGRKAIKVDFFKAGNSHSSVYTAWTKSSGPTTVYLSPSVYWLRATPPTGWPYIMPEKTGFLSPAGGTRVELDFVAAIDQMYSTQAAVEADQGGVVAQDDLEPQSYLPIIMNSGAQPVCFPFAGNECRTPYQWVDWYLAHKQVKHYPMVTERNLEAAAAFAYDEDLLDVIRYLQVVGNEFPLMYLPTFEGTPFFPTWNAVTPGYFQKTEIAINQIVGFNGGPGQFPGEYVASFLLLGLYCFPFDPMELYVYRVDNPWVQFRVKTDFSWVHVLSAAEAASMLQDLQDEYGESGMGFQPINITENQAEFLCYVRDAGILMIVIFAGTTLFVMTVTPGVPPPP